MSSIQYTIRSIPPSVDRSLREHAKKTGMSFNSAVVDALKRATGSVSENSTHYTDLDWFIGSSVINKAEFDDSLKWLESLPNNPDFKL
jgi:hypothetical protein